MSVRVAMCLLGPAANTFLLPQGLTNRHWYKTYFSTYSCGCSAVNVTSLGGECHDPPGRHARGATALAILHPLALWLSQICCCSKHRQLRFGLPAVAAPGRDVRTAPFETLADAHAGHVEGRIALQRQHHFAGGPHEPVSPSPSGTVGAVSPAGALNGLVPTGMSNTILTGRQTTVWRAATVNLSDADPASIPGVLTPFSLLRDLLQSRRLPRP
jgi:filamentous hemagglutinin